ncbi:hypothetical protein FRC0534_01113 [Corynebacterium diphtheriae]|nr:hypothetical protein FRC0534_01113 [Corynebacterium diphtheriae]
MVTQSTGASGHKHHLYAARQVYVLVKTVDAPIPGIMCSGWVEQSSHEGNVAILRTSQKKHLILHRCTGCAKTSVWDGQQFWDLDEEDYGPKGSYERQEN